MKKYISLISISLILFISAQQSVAQVSFWGRNKVAKKINRDMKSLAKEGLNERKMGSPDELHTAMFLAERFGKIGLDSLQSPAYLQTINVPTLRMAQPKTTLTISGRVFTLFSNFYPISSSSNNGKYVGTAINVAYGIEDPGLDRSDYTGKDVTGKAVIINLALPADQKSAIRYSAWEALEDRVAYAIGRGAKAILFSSTDPNFIPQGKLAKMIENSNIPILFVSQDLSDLLEPMVDLNVDIMLISEMTQNVIGKVNNNARTTVLITTHHDNTYTTYEDLRNNSRSVASFLALANEIKNNPKKFGHNDYVFASFTGYENNKIGASHLLNSSLTKSFTFNYILSIDDFTNLDSNFQILALSGIGSSPAFTSISKHVVPKKINALSIQNSVDSLSEAAIYYDRSIPVLSVEAHSKYTTDSKRAKPGRNEANMVHLITEILANLDIKSGEYKKEGIAEGAPEKVLTTIPFTRIIK